MASTRTETVDLQKMLQKKRCADDTPDKEQVSMNRGSAEYCQAEECKIQPSKQLQNTQLAEDRAADKIPLGGSMGIADRRLAADKEELPVLSVKTEAVELPFISDFDGRVSNLLDLYARKIQQRIVPICITGLPENLKNLERYRILEIDGKRYAEPKDADTGILQLFEKEIMESLCSGKKYETSLVCEFEYYGKTIKSLRLSSLEWSILVSRFRNYHASVSLIHSTGDIVLEVEGIRFSIEE